MKNRHKLHKNAHPALAVQKNAQSNELPLLQERIRQRAYEIHLEHGCVQGRDWDNWLLAEREIKASLNPDQR